MKEDFDFLSLVHEDFLGRLDSSEIITEEGISLIKSNIPHIPFNVCLIDSDDASKQQNTLEKKINVPTIFYVSQKSKSGFLSWSSSLNIIHENTFSFMEGKKDEEYRRLPIYDDIKIYRVIDEISMLKDFVILYAKSKAVEPMEIYQLFSNVLENQYIYLVYVNEKPAGYFTGISIGDKAFSTDAYVEEKYREIGLLKIIANYAKQDGIRHGVNKFYAFSMAPESHTVLSNHDFIEKERLNIFIHSE